MMDVIDLSRLPEREIAPGFHSRLAHGQAHEPGAY
jgi:hypothetical protein